MCHDVPKPRFNASVGGGGGMGGGLGSAVGRVRVGISGWTYAGWRGKFYPEGLVQRRELEYVGSRMSSVEINGTFYSLQRPPSFLSWHRATPKGFVFAVKGSRFITHPSGGCTRRT